MSTENRSRKLRPYAWPAAVLLVILLTAWARQIPDRRDRLLPAAAEPAAVSERIGSPQETSAGTDRARSPEVTAEFPKFSDTRLPGRLRQDHDGRYVSPAGLIYGPGGREGHRLQHIFRHLDDDLSRPIHGVFLGDQDDVLRCIDQALKKVVSNSRDVRQRHQNGRTAWTVRMDETIGYVGGRSGQARNHPDCRFLRIVVEEDGRTVVTAYPVNSF